MIYEHVCFLQNCPLSVVSPSVSEICLASPLALRDRLSFGFKAQLEGCNVFLDIHQRRSTMASLLTFACASILSFSLLLDCSFAASSPSVSSFSYGDFSDVYPSGYTLPPSPSLTGIFASEASAEAAAASKASSAAQASSSSVDEHLSPKNMYLDKMCSPISSKGVPDQDYPCNKAVTLASTCVYGEDYANKSTRGVAPPYPPPKDRSAKDQQQCLCPGGKGQDYFQFYIGWVTRRSSPTIQADS